MNRHITVDWHNGWYIAQDKYSAAAATGETEEEAIENLRSMIGMPIYLVHIAI